MQTGRIMFGGTGHELLANPEVRAAYLDAGGDEPRAVLAGWRYFSCAMPTHANTCENPMPAGGRFRCNALPLRVILTMALAFGAGAAKAQDIAIAVVGPITGSNAALGEQMTRGAKMAVADINAKGGVLGRK